MNTATNKKQSFVSAMKSFFGFREGQGLSDFTTELKALTDDDKRYFHAELNKAGIISRTQFDQIRTSAEVYRESARASQATTRSREVGTTSRRPASMPR